VAAGGIQTPALLLRSGFRHPGIGRGLRLDPTTGVGGVYRHDIRMWAGVPQTLTIDRWLGLGDHHGFWIETAPAHPGLTALGFPWQGGRAHKERMRLYRHLAANIILVRDTAAGRVMIDRQGNPVMEYRINGYIGIGRKTHTLAEGVAPNAQFVQNFIYLPIFRPRHRVAVSKRALALADITCVRLDESSFRTGSHVFETARGPIRCPKAYFPPPKKLAGELKALAPSIEVVFEDARGRRRKYSPLVTRRRGRDSGGKRAQPK